MTIYYVLGLVIGVILGHGLAEAGEPDCYEDEVIVWTGEAHTRCVPLDNLTE